MNTTPGHHIITTRSARRRAALWALVFIIGAAAGVRVKYATTTIDHPVAVMNIGHHLCKDHGGLNTAHWRSLTERWRFHCGDGLIHDNVEIKIGAGEA